MRRYAVNKSSNNIPSTEPTTWTETEKDTDTKRDVIIDQNVCCYFITPHEDRKQLYGLIGP